MTDRRRFPLDPLAHLMGVELGRVGGSQPGQPKAGLAALAERLGISHTMAQRLNTHGLSEDQADRYATRIGHHPGCIWPDWWTPNERTETIEEDDDYAFEF